MEAQDREFATFGIINKKLKAGLLIGLLSLSLTGNILMVYKLISLQGELYNKMLEIAAKSAREEANRTLEEPVKNIERVTARADTAISQSINAAKTADSAGMVIIKKQEK